MKLLSKVAVVITFVGLAGCNFNPCKKEEAQKQLLPEYVAISPVTLPPLATESRNKLKEIYGNDYVDPPFDTDLLVLPAVISKAQYKFLNLKADGTIVIGSGDVQSDRHRALYDIMNMSSFPVEVKLKDKDDNPFTVRVTPYIGVGVRVVAEYEYDGKDASLNLTGLAAKVDEKEGNGSINIEQVGISRYGSNNQAVSSVSLTPKNIDQSLQSIGYMLGQIWLKDTRIQPMLIGYSVPGYPGLDAKYHKTIVNEITKNVRIKEIAAKFEESMFYELSQLQHPEKLSDLNKKALSELQRRVKILSAAKPYLYERASDDEKGAKALVWDDDFIYRNYLSLIEPVVTKNESGGVESAPPSGEVFDELYKRLIF